MTDAAFALNVNDDEATRYLVTRILTGAGFAVVEAANGLDALEHARRRPSIIVLDIKLPDISGLEVCRRIKADPQTRDIPVLQTSATFVSTERKVAGLESGADAYLAQPIEAPELVATVRALIRAQRAERGLETAAREWRKTFDVIADGVALVTADGRIVRCNQAWVDLHRIDFAQLLGRRLIDLPGPAEKLATITVEATRLRQRVVGEALVGHQLLRLVADPMVDDDGVAERVVLLVSDITAHRQLEEDHRRRAEELAQTARRKDEFLGMLAHELRNPLHALSAALSLMDRVGGQDDRNVRLRNAARRQTHHLARLVDDLLEVSRITRGKLQLHREPCDLAAIVASAIDNARPFLDARDQRLRLDLPAGGAVPLVADPLRIEQVLVNLLQNASKYSEPSTEIDLSCRVTGDPALPRAVIAVRDHGIGIPSSHLQAIFEPFVQVDQSLARSLGGLGVGLTLAKLLVELHGGTIAARSDGEGAGSVFEIVLPVGRAASRPDAPSGLHGDAGVSGEQVHVRSIVVVEDNPDAREMLTAWLNELGHRAHAAAHGLEAVEVARRVRPEIVLLDIGLPGMDGYQVAETLRRLPECAEALIVALTGYGRPEDMARARAVGFDGHLVKPVQPEVLARFIHLPRRQAIEVFAQRWMRA